MVEAQRALLDELMGTGCNENKAMFFIDSSDIKFGTFLNYVFHNIINEIGSKKYQQNCGQSFWDGQTRDLTAEERKKYREIKWDDKEVCGCYLVKFCPHELFVNTKSDLGPCPKIHDPKLKESYKQSTRRDLYTSRFEAELFQFCEKLIQDLDRKVRRGRERLAQDVDTSSLIPISTEKSDQLVNIEESIKKILEDIETFGEEGKVDEAEALMKKVDVLNIEKSIVNQQIHNERGLVLSQEKKMALCETCGSFLVANDATERTQSHMTGKQHIGFGLVRKYIFEYHARKDKEKVQEEQRGVRNQDDKKNHDIDDKEKEKILFDKERDIEQEQEGYRRIEQRYSNYEQASPRRATKRDQRDREQERVQQEHGQERDHCSNRDCHYKNNSKKHCKSDWDQPLRHKITRPSQFPPESTIHNRHVATLNQYPRRRSRSPDHRV